MTTFKLLLVRIDHFFSLLRHDAFPPIIPWLATPLLSIQNAKRSTEQYKQNEQEKYNIVNEQEKYNIVVCTKLYEGKKWKMGTSLQALAGFPKHHKIIYF